MDTLFFVAAKLVWGLLRPDSMLALLLAAGVLALWLGRARLGTALVTVSFGALLPVGFLPLGDALMAPLEARYPPEPEINGPVAGILVLGGAEDPAAVRRWGQPAANDAAERYLGAIALARRHPEARALLTGGSAALMAADGDPIEAQIAERFLVDAGVSADRLLLEGRSRNTAENAAFSLALADEARLLDRGAWILVTSAFHMPRAVETFCAAGWRGLIAWPVDFRSGALARAPGWNLAGGLGRLDIAAREWIGTLAYRLTGRAAPPSPECVISRRLPS